MKLIQYMLYLLYLLYMLCLLCLLYHSAVPLSRLDFISAAYFEKFLSSFSLKFLLRSLIEVTSLSSLKARLLLNWLRFSMRSSTSAAIKSSLSSFVRGLPLPFGTFFTRFSYALYRLSVLKTSHP